MKFSHHAAGPIRGLIATAAAWVLASAGHAQGLAQRPPPHIGYVYPAGGQQGTTLTVSVGGQNLADASAAYFSGAGVSAKVTGYDRPLTQKEINDLREQLQQLQEKRAAARGLPPPKPPGAPALPAKPVDVPAAPPGPPPAFTADDEARLGEIRAKLMTRANRQANPAIAENVTLELTLAPDAPPGERELRLLTATGLSNPFMFCVGQLPEFVRPVATVTNTPAPRQNRGPDARNSRPKPAEMRVTLPAVVNGQILPGEVNRFRFAARQGERLTAIVSARALIPYLADAVPGWFQATLALYDAHGREVAYQDRYRFNPDPALGAEIPADGDYVLEIKDAIYRGREDFVYRIAIGELPFVTSIFPLGCAPDQIATFELRGWSLPAQTATLNPTGKTTGMFSFPVPAGGRLAPPVSLAIDPQPECREAEPNDRPGDAQPLTLPIIVNGRIERSDDIDMFRLEGKAGDVLVAEIVARRLGSPLDSTLELTDASGRRLAFNDDNDDKAAGLLTHQADSRVSLTLPADGTYFVRVADAQHQGGPEFAYRLHVGAPRPDFELRVVPSSINLRSGGAVPVTVYALRRDGFTGEISLALRDPPRGLSLSGARIPANQDKIQLTITATPPARDEPFALTLTGTAEVQGHPVLHAAIPAEDMMQAFAYRQLVPAQELRAVIVGRGAMFRVLGRTPVKIPAGGQVHIRLATPATRFVSNVQFELSDPPDGLAITASPAEAGFFDLVVSCDAAKIKPGLQGNLLLNASGERNNPNAAKAVARPQRLPLGTVPAIPFEIISPVAEPAG